MKLLNVASIEHARKLLLECASGWAAEVERLKLERAAGRTLAETLSACEPIPAFRRSVVDGYALVSRDTDGAGETMPVFLNSRAAVEMGKAAPEPVFSGQCAYVPTGGMVPEGADAVVMVEYSEKFGSDGIAVYQSVAPGQGLVQAGEDVSVGSVLLERGCLLRPQEIGVLAAAGVVDVPVYASLRLAIISTGDELAPPEADLKPGEVRDINSHALRALAEQRGYAVEFMKVLPDDEKALEEALRAAMAVCDVVAVSGGSSQGDKDMTRDVMARVSAPGVLLHGLAMKPGKPTILAYDAASGSLLAGLPGHPVAALMVFELLFGWLGNQLAGRKPALPFPARMACNVPGAPGLVTCLSVRLAAEAGEYRAEPVFGKSGLISTLAQADGYVLIDMNKEGLQKDEAVLVHLWRSAISI